MFAWVRKASTRRCPATRAEFQPISRRRAGHFDRLFFCACATWRGAIECRNRRLKTETEHSFVVIKLPLHPFAEIAPAHGMSFYLPLGASFWPRMVTVAFGLRALPRFCDVPGHVAKQCGGWVDHFAAIGKTSPSAASAQMERAIGYATLAQRSTTGKASFSTPIDR